MCLDGSNVNRDRKKVKPVRLSGAPVFYFMDEVDFQER
jgi:hypothetical protein